MRRFPPVPRRVPFARLFSGIAIAVGLALTTISAQIPGRNVNMVAGNSWPNGDPYLQRQNEPSIGASTRNPLHLLAGANDYRTVDLPGLADDEIGDAWLGLFKSYDGGQRWSSSLLPGYPQDHSASGMSSPIKGYGAGADPVIRAGTNGLMYYAGLAFDRANPATPDIPGKSAIFVARFIDNNNKEAGDPFEYLGTRALQTDPGGATGNFLDKPWMVVDIPRDNSRCTIVTAGEKGPITQNIPAGPVYVAYTLRSTDNKGSRYDVMFTRSADCGNTWTPPIKLNDPNERANQGAALAVDPRNGNVYIGWRQFDLSTNGTGTDALMVAKFTLASKKFDKPGFARKFAKPKKGKGKGLDPNHFFKKGGINKALEAAELSPLDQSTSAAQIRFRTNAYPSMVVDEAGRVYLAFAERGYDPLSPDPVLGSARVLVTTSTDGSSWTTAQPVSSGEPNQRGHQLMPAITYAGNRLMLIYYDVRESRAQAFTQYIDDRTAFQPGVGTGLRHTIDLRASMASPAAVPQFTPSVAVSEYIEGPRVPGGPSAPWQVNPPNLPMFQKGTAPFIGDYVDIAAAPNFVVNAAGKWVYNSSASSTPPIFHAAWTDNRDVRVPLHDMNGDGNPWNDYVPPGAPGGVASIFDPTKVVPQCIPGNAGSRNQNIYTARITGGLLVGSPGNSKRLGFRVDENGNPTNQLMQRSFVVFAQNTSDTLKRFRFTINNQPAGGRASFDQFSAAPLTAIDADIPYRSTASRTVYASSTDPHAIINVSVAELVLVNGQYVVKTGGLASVIVLNPDIDNPDIDNPDIDNPDIDNPDIDNVEVYNPDIDNPDIDNPDIDNPDIDNPDIDNPDIDNVEVANPDIDNPDIDNPDIDNPDIDNPDIDNPDIDNPDIDNASLMTDVSWSITNTGNTTASYNVNLFFAQQTFDPSIKTQLILYRTYKTPVVVNCELKSETRNMLVANVPNPQLVKGSTGTVSDPNDSAATNATIYLAPGESAKITLRIFDPSPDEVVTVTNRDGSTALISAQFVPNEDVTLVVQQQSVNTEDVDAGVTEPPVVVQFPPPQTAPDSASTSENTPVTLNPLANDSTAFGSTKIISFHPEGMGAHSGGGPGDITYQPATGFLYTQRGIVDPATNTLVGRLGLPPGGTVAYQQANPRTGINYQRTTPQPNAVLSALDARPDSLTFHQYLSMPALADSVMTFAIDAVRNRLYVLHGEANTTPTARSWFSVIDINPSNETFHSVLYTIALPDGLRGNAVAVNSRTQKVYLTTGFGQGATTAAVYVVDDGPVAVHTATRIPNTFGTSAIAVNESSNQVFVSSSVFINSVQVYQLLVIDGATLAVAAINTNLPPRLNNADERLVVHNASGRVFVRLGSSVVVFDGRKGSPSRNTVLAVIPVGADANNADIAIDQELGRVITTGGFDFRADVIDVATLQSFVVPLSNAGSDVAIDPLHHVGFVSTALTSVVKVDLTGAVGPVPVAVFVEAGGPIINPVTNRAYLVGTAEDSGIPILTGAGFTGEEVPVANDNGRFNFSARQESNNRFFILNAGNQAGTSSGPGTVVVVDGADDSVIRYLNALPNPFGIGIDQVSAKAYVASFSGDTTNGGLRMFDLNNLNAPGVDATFTTGVGSTTGFALNNSNALIGFSRFVVPNPNDHRVFVAVNGGTLTSIAIYDPTTNVIAPLDGRAGTVLFDYQAAHDESWGRANIIRVDSTQNRIIVGFDNGTTNRIVVLNGSTLQVMNNFVLGRHSNRHTASYIVLDEAMQRMFVSNFSAGTVTMLDSASYAPIATVSVAPGPSAQALNLTAHRLYVSSIDTKTLSAIDYTASAMTLVSSVRLPLVAYFLAVDEVESRVYTGGGDSLDESGAMVVTDVLGRLGIDVNITNVSSSGHGTVTLNDDSSVTYRPAHGFAGVDTFNYTLEAPTGTAIGTVTINVVPSAPALLSFGDAYAATVNQPLTVAAPGPLGNDAAGSGLVTMVVDSTTTNGQLTPQQDGSFLYVPGTGFSGTDSFTYHAVSQAGTTNVSTVTITVSSPTALVVTTTADSGAGSLRQAMAVSQVEPASTITFNIPGEGPHVIQPQSALPTLSARVTIDGYTQPGSTLNTSPIGTNAVLKIHLVGSSAGGNVHGLLISGGGTTVRGLAISGFSGAGIQLDADGGNVIEGNFLGTNAAGTSASGNGAGGIIVQSGGNMIGGNTFAARNLISGNAQAGVRVQARTLNGVVVTEGSGSVVKGNLIGTSASGLNAIPNANNGISVSVSNVIIGGTSIAERNVISGNTGFGINTFALTFTPVTGGPVTVMTRPDDLLVHGNYIGVGADGLAAVPNTNTGVNVNGRSIIGGAAGATAGACTGACNVISGNGGDGVGIFAHSNNGIVFSSAATTQVMGNFVGLNVAGNAVPNGPPLASRFSAGITVGVENVAIGSTNPLDRNVISGNNGAGINLAYSFIGVNGVAGSVASAAGAVVAGNFIGVGPNGTTTRGNGETGIIAAAPNIAIGGALVAARNIISGNAGSAIFVGASQADPDNSGPMPLGPLTPPVIGADVVIRNNYLGTDVSGTVAVPNARGGVEVSAPRATVDNNLISGNTQTGLRFGNHYDATTGQLHASGDHGLAIGNRIGVAANGSDPLPNTGSGIFISAPDVAIGGNLASHRNIIAGNGGDGIAISTNTTNSNAVVASGERASIRGNSIGLTQSGTVMLVNGQNGVSSTAANVTIGGPSPNHGNRIVAALNRQAINLGRQTAAGGTVINPGGSSTVQNNILGLDMNGARLNARGGPISISSGGNQILGNTIAGNGTGQVPTTAAISISAFGAPNSANGNIIRGNYIGTTPGGVTGLHNFGAAITINNASGTQIGGVGEGNTIVGGNDIGIFISAGPDPDSVSNGTGIIGNRIGVMPDGQTPQDPANRVMTGIMVISNGGQIAGTIIGGSTPASRNIIGNMPFNGVALYNAGVSNAVIRGNHIGVANDGVTQMPIGAAGVWLSGTSDNEVGGPGPADANIIAFSSQAGVGVNNNGVRNRITGNSIHSNGGLGIDLEGNNAVEINDSGDADTGANNRQNYPVLSNANNTTGVTRVGIDLSTFAAGNTYVVQVFSNPACDGTHGEGRRLVGTFNLAQPGNGDVALGELVDPSHVLTATATSPAGDTSEFSQCAAIGFGTVVTNTNLTGPGSLAEAMTNANRQPGTQTITFNIPGAGAGSPAVISLGGVPMPIITESVVIDATTQPGYDGRPVIHLNGNGNVANGFETAPDVYSVAIRGFSITRFSNAGILFMQADGGQFAGNQAQLNFIGTDRNHENGLGNGVGIVVRTDYSTIGQNVISGNLGAGVRLESDADHVVITGNKIGTTVDGQGALGNSDNGITMYDSLNNNVIDGNTISGNLGWGVDIQDSLAGDVSFTRIRANTIGLDASGNILGNAAGGIRINNAPSTGIGEPGGTNYISGNGGPGIHVVSNLGQMAWIRNNYIGLDPTGELARSNNNKGVVLDGPAVVGSGNPGEGNWISGNGTKAGGAGVFIGLNAGGSIVAGNTIGLSTSNAALGNGYSGVTVTANTRAYIGEYPNGRNIISGNGVYGISILNVDLDDPRPANHVVEYNIIGSDATGTLQRGNGQAGINVTGTDHRIGAFNAVAGNVIVNNGSQGGIRIFGAASGVQVLRNNISSNAGPGIDLGGDGPTANDGAADGDFGPNGLQNYAPMVLAANNGGQTRVKYDANTLNPGVSHTIEFFSSPFCDTNGFGEGSMFRGSTTINGGAGTQTLILDSEVPLGHVITATATDPLGNTSEFSNCTEVVQATTWTAGGSGTTNVANGGETLTPAMNYNHSGTGIFAGNWTFNTVAAAADTIELDYFWNGFHSFFLATARLDVFVNRGGVDVYTATLLNEGPETCPPCTPPSNGFNYFGTTSVAVQPGDTYGFRMSGTHSDGTYVLSGTLQLTVRP